MSLSGLLTIGWSDRGGCVLGRRRNRASLSLIVRPAMRKSLFPVDDSLPTWLHTFACFFVVSLFGMPLIWWGGEAIHFQHLESITGPEIGQYFFGSAALDGKAAVWAGWSLIMFGAAFFALGARFTRAGRESAVLRLLPWLLIGASVLIALPVGRHK